jgi:hypothetical protein
MTQELQLLQQLPKPGSSTLQVAIITIGKSFNRIRNLSRSAARIDGGVSGLGTLSIDCIPLCRIRHPSHEQNALRQFVVNDEYKRMVGMKDSEFWRLTREDDYHKSGSRGIVQRMFQIRFGEHRLDQIAQEAKGANSVRFSGQRPTLTNGAE